MDFQLSTFNFQLKAKRGFALLLTVTLLAFLVVLLVGLAAYTRVETAVAGNTQRQAQARQNALLALNVALGQLQKYAGPDQRVTATADAFPNASGTKHYTGVWDTTLSARTTPVTWLVSGNELSVAGVSAPRAVRPNSSFTTTNSVELVGKNSSGTASDVLARLMPITTVGLPGATAATTAIIGRYAWWVGDQGVKAPVALADPTSTAANFNYAPFASAELLSRIRQQISLGAGAADSTGAAVFEPRDTTGTPSNAALAANVTATNQLAFFNKTGGGTVGLPTLQQYFHTWSPNNFAVLANTKLGGLRQDLSLFSPSTTPSPLGTAFDAWANYNPANGGYMEDFTNPATPTPLPAYSSDPMRRRYVMQAQVSNAGAVHSVAPILSYFLLTFSICTQGNTATVAPLVARARWGLTFWNPYTSALVPENLRIEITGLPDVAVLDTTTPATLLPPISLQTIFGNGSGAPMKISLPWDSTTNATPDTQSWLPGRVYSWSSLDSAVAAPTATGFGSTFYSQNISATAGQGAILPANSGPVKGTDNCQLSGGQSTLVVKLFAVRASGDVPLATFTSPQFSNFQFASSSAQISDYTYQFSFVFRLAESDNGTGAWLTSGGYDVRSPTLPAAAFVSGPNGPDPDQYPNYVTFSAPDRLLDRATTSLTYDEDVPVFELPCSPLLSVGSLQHLQIAGTRPFAIGNSWGEAVQLAGPNGTFTGGALFDQFFYSGLAPNVTPVPVNGTLVLPNPLLKPLPRNSATGTLVTLGNLQNAPNQQSSKFLLLGGAFNLNSVNPTAWEAVLRSVRFPETPGFTYLNADPTTGTGPDAPPASPPIQSSDAQFFRFGQSAQETYLADINTGSPPTWLFRQGMRTLTAAQVSALATAITNLIKVHQAVSGPFRTLEEVLGPVSAGTPSLIEQAIIDTDSAGAGINSSIAEFSSQWLTQGDIMTALAPVLFPRSDTFVIRTYGEAVNPTTAATEGRAWCEAIAQRVPAYFDTADPEETAPLSLNPTNTAFGRRFKIISFRWLTRSDI